MAADEQPAASPPDRHVAGGGEDDAWRPDWDPQRLTGGATEGSSAPDRRAGRIGPSLSGIVSGALALALVVAAAVVLLGRGGEGRTSPAGQPSSASSTAAPDPGTSGAVVPDQAALAAAREVFAQVNAEAGSTPARQRSVLERVADPAQQANQRGCAAAVTTVRLIPAWSDVRVAADGHLIVPSLVRIFTGTRITGTDVAIIDVSITAGRAGLPALCVS